MPNDFLEQFMAGWQMGQGRNESMRRNQELQMEQARQAQMAQQRAEEFALQREEFAARKKALAAEEAAHKVNAAKEAYQLKSQALDLQGSLPTPTAQEVGIQQAVPDVGPPVSQINVPQPAMDIPNPVEGQPAISMPILTGRQQEAEAAKEQLRKQFETLMAARAHAQAAAEYRQPERPVSVAPGGTLVNPATGKVVYRAPAPVTGSTGTDPALEAVAQGLSNYEIGLSDLGRMPQGAKAAVFAKAKEINPNFNASLYASRQKLRADFTSGKTAGNIDSLNTAVAHIGALKEFGDALNNGNVQLANQIGNGFATATGNPAPTNFQTMATAVESEVASLLKKAGATDQEINSWRANFGKNMSPAQIKGAIATTLDVMRGRERALQQRWKTGMGAKEDYPVYGEEQQQILQSLGYGQESASGVSTSTPTRRRVYNPKTGEFE